MQCLVAMSIVMPRIITDFSLGNIVIVSLVAPSSPSLSLQLTTNISHAAAWAADLLGETLTLVTAPATLLPLLSHRTDGKSRGLTSLPTLITKLIMLP